MLQRGFTLIELMIAVAIIGILVAVAVPAYSKYHDKSKVQAGFYEIASARAQFETQLNDGNTTLTLADVGLQVSTKHCSFVAVTYDVSTGEGSITCTLLGSGAVNGKTISAIRSNSGTWSCVSDSALDPALKPTGCS